MKGKVTLKLDKCSLIMWNKFKLLNTSNLSCNLNQILLFQTMFIFSDYTTNTSYGYLNWCFHTKEDYTAMRINQLLLHTARRTHLRNLKTTTLSKSQTQKRIQCMSSKRGKSKRSLSKLITLDIPQSPSTSSFPILQIGHDLFNQSQVMDIQKSLLKSCSYKEHCRAGSHLYLNSHRKRIVS